MRKQVLITNFNYKNSLAAVRALGKKGISITTCGSNLKNRVSAFSKYNSGWTVYTDPKENLEKFVFDIKETVKEKRFDLIMPIGVDTTIPISYYKEMFTQYAEVPVADYDILIEAHDKYRAIKWAKKADVPVPKTHLFKGELDSMNLTYPVVIKARKGASGSGTRYASSREEVERILQDFGRRESNLLHDFEFPMIQEYIPGEIRDVCVLCNHGEPRAVVAQKRVLTYPPQGGVGIVNETIEDPHLIELTFRLLSEMRWHGVAQVEFKLDIDGAPRLMEINPKFWGTLDLSIAAGVNFPYMLYEMTMEGDVKPCFSYNKNLQIWWLSAHYPQIILAVLKGDRSSVTSLVNSKKRRVGDLWISDIKPHIIQMVGGIVKLYRFRRLINHNLAYTL